MYDVVIIHGSFGNPYENWFPWLYKKLSDEGKNVLVPDFPTPSSQNLDSWMKVMNAYIDLIDENTIFIAHSIAPAFVVDFLIKNKKSVKGLVAIAPFYGLINIQEFDEINSTFFEKDISLNDVTNYTSFIHCFYSDDDPYVPIALSETFVKETNASSVIIPKGKHLNASSGYSEFQEIINVIHAKN